MSVYRGIGADSRKEEKKKANMVRLTHGRKSFFLYTLLTFKILLNVFVIENVTTI